MSATIWAVDWAAIFTPRYGLAEMIVRGTVMYFLIVALLRLVVKRQSGGLGTTDVLVVVLIADVAGPGFMAESISIVEAGVSLSTILFWSWLIEWTSCRVPAFARMLDPPAVMLVEDGRIVMRNMRAHLVTTDELMSRVRQAGVEELSRVKAARMEPDGMISVILRDDPLRPTTAPAG